LTATSRRHALGASPDRRVTFHKRPNRLVWDLDPGPDIMWKQVVTAAKLVRDVPATLGMTSWVKTTGGRGLHVVVPLRPHRKVAACLDFSRAVAEAIEQTNARLYTTKFLKAGRENQLAARRARRTVLKRGS
jgi:bifunctional non-homologous end joining protein LigD